MCNRPPTLCILQVTQDSVQRGICHGALITGRCSLVAHTPFAVGLFQLFGGKLWGAMVADTALLPQLVEHQHSCMAGVQQGEAHSGQEAPPAQLVQLWGLLLWLLRLLPCLQRLLLRP